MKRKPIIGVMGGGGRLPEKALDQARRLGESIAKRGWILLNGGRGSGIMDASAIGAHTAGGLVVGVLPSSDLDGASEYLDVPIRTGMGNARNVINVLSSDVVVVFPGGVGTLSEAALAIKSGRPVVLFGFDPGPAVAAHERSGRVARATSVAAAIEAVEEFLSRG